MRVSLSDHTGTVAGTYLTNNLVQELLGCTVSTLRINARTEGVAGVCSSPSSLVQIPPPPPHSSTKSFTWILCNQPVFCHLTFSQLPTPLICLSLVHQDNSHLYLYPLYCQYGLKYMIAPSYLQHQKVVLPSQFTTTSHKFSLKKKPNQTSIQL